MPWYWPFSRGADDGAAAPAALNEDALRSLRAQMRRQYAAAGFNRLLNDWVASSTSSDAELLTSLRTLRNRSRQMARDNDYVVSALRLIQNNVIGPGVRMQAQIKGSRGPGAGRLSSSTNQKVEDEWRKWCRADSCHAAGRMSFADIERLLVRHVAMDGEVFVRLISQRMGRSKVPLALELIEADQLDENYNGTADTGNEIRMGVEIDKWQRPVAYWFFEHHPGDYQNVKPGTARRLRVPADEVIHLYRPDRISQTRGVPWFVSALLRLRHMSGYEEAEVIAARATACQMGFIQTADPDHELGDDDVMDLERVDNFEPGKIVTLAPGETFSSFNPTRPSGLLDPFMRYMLRGVAAGVGVSYEGISKDYSQSNYSSSRLALLDDRDTWREIQRWMIETFHQRVHERFMDMATLSGALSLPGYEANTDAYINPRWIPRGWSWVDPAKEIAAYKTAVRGGMMSMTDVVAQNGGDFEELLHTRQRELELCRELGIVFDTDPNVVDSTGKAQPNDPTDPPDPDAASEDGEDQPDDEGEAGQTQNAGGQGQKPSKSGQPVKKKAPPKD